MCQSVSRFAFCLVFALFGGSVRPAIAESIAVRTLTLPQKATAIVWDATRSRFFVACWPNVLMINPDTASVEDTIPVGGVADQIAVSSDGQYLYASLSGRGRLDRYRVRDHALVQQIELGMNAGTNVPREVKAMAALPGQPSSILVSLSDRGLTIFDNAVGRAITAPVDVRSLYVRPSDGALFGLGDGPPGWGSPQVLWLTASSAGVTVARSVAVDPNWDNGTVTWRGNLVTERDPLYSSVFDLDAGATIGRVPRPESTGSRGGCALAADVSGTSVIAYEYAYRFEGSTTSLIQYELANLRPAAAAALTGLPNGAISGACTSSQVATWGTDGIVVMPGNSYPPMLYFLHTAGLAATPPAPIPTPTRDASGVIHLALPANGLVFDPRRNVLWASVPGNAAAAGNAVVSIDPFTGSVLDTIFAGSEPGALAFSGDGSRLFAALAGASAVSSIDLSAKRTWTYSVLDSSGFPYWTALGVAGLAGESNSFAAVRAAHDRWEVHSSVAVYDAGLPRKNRFDNGVGPGIYSQYVQTIFPADAANAFYAANTGTFHSDGTNDVFRLVANSSGVSLDKQLTNLYFGQGDGAYGTLGRTPPRLVWDGARLLTSAGQILTPDTKRILGTVALTPAYAVPVPFSDQNGVVLIHKDGPQVSATFYDLETLRPLESIQMAPRGCNPEKGNPVDVAAAVRAGNAVAIATNCEVVIAPLAGFQPWSSSTGALLPVSAGVRQIDLPANAISALPGTSKLLLATPSKAGSMGNSVVTFNSETGGIERAAFAGSEPAILSAAPDGSAVYAYLAGEFNVARLNATSGSRDLAFAADPTGGSYRSSVFDMAVSPEGALAVSYSGSIALGGKVEAAGLGGTIALFDNGVARPKADFNSQGPFANGPATFHLAFNDTGSLLYSYNSFLSSFELKRDAVTAKGLEWLSTAGWLIGGYSAKIRYVQGLLYTSYGDVVDPERGVGVGRFVDPWLGDSRGTFGDVAVDAAGGRVYFLTSSGILVFDLHTYALVGRLSINLSASGISRVNLVKFGPNSLAFLVPSGRAYVVEISAIPPLAAPVASPQPPFIAVNGIVPLFSSVPVVQPGSWISIFGANLAGSTATWNGDFPTTLAGTSVSINSQPAYLWYVSPNQINLQVPDEGATGPVYVKVTTANGSATSSVTLSRFGPSLSLLDDRYVAAAIAVPGGSGAYGGGTYDLAGPAGRFGFQTRPVRSGETLLLYGVGFGPTNPAVPAGQPFTGAAPTTEPVKVTIGGKPASVLFSGLVAAGLYQINVTVPPVDSGDRAVEVAVGGTKAPLAIVSVQ